MLEQGWKVVEPRRANDGKKKNREDEQEDPPQAIPPRKRGQELRVKWMDVVGKETKPPAPYTDATLLAAMKNAGRELADDELASVMKESGLGTPATRAETIEKLIRTGYAVRERKSILSTDKGRALIGLVAGSLCSPLPAPPSETTPPAAGRMVRYLLPLPPYTFLRTKLVTKVFGQRKMFC